MRDYGKKGIAGSWSFTKIASLLLGLALLLWALFFNKTMQERILDLIDAFLNFFK